MNKFALVISSAFVLAASCVQVEAAPAVSLDSTVGLLGSPVAQTPIQDPVVQKALEWIQSKQIKKERKEKLGPASTIGHKPRKQFNHSQRMILGGPEVVPM